MFINLIGKEIKYQLKSLTFYLFFGILLLFFFTQFASEVPKQSLADKSIAGGVTITNETEKMETVYRNLVQVNQRGEVFRYGFIINKTVRLSAEEKKAVQEAMTQMAPQGKIAISYDTFLSIMRQLDKKLGGSTEFGDKWRDYSLVRPMTQEEISASFKSMVEEDKVTNAYGRYFADYMGITAGLFPIFLGAFVLTRDLRVGVHELIYSRKVSSLTYVLSKYLALCILVTFCYVILATYATFSFIRLAEANQYVIDYLAFYKFTFAWILPTAMFSLAMGMFISVLFGNGVVAVPIQFLMWMTSMLPLKGDYGLTKSVIRFNVLGMREAYLDWLREITINRIFYVFLSFGIIILATWVWSLKRRVGSHGFFTKIFKPRQI